MVAISHENKNLQGSPSSDESSKDTVRRLTILEDKVSDLKGDLVLKHGELEDLSRDHSDELVRGLTFLRGRIENSGLKVQLNEEIAKNVAKDELIQKLIERVEKLEEEVFPSTQATYSQAP